MHLNIIHQNLPILIQSWAFKPTNIFKLEAPQKESQAKSTLQKAPVKQQRRLKKWRRSRRHFSRPCLANHPTAKTPITIRRIGWRTLQSIPRKTLAGNPSARSTAYGSAETSSLRKSNPPCSPQSKKVSSFSFLLPYVWVLRKFTFPRIKWVWSRNFAVV